MYVYRHGSTPPLQIDPHPPRHATRAPHLLGHRAPDDLAHLDADLLDGVYGPDDVEVLVLVDDPGVHDAHVRLTLLVPQAAQQPPAVDEVIAPRDPQRHGGHLFVEPGRRAARLALVAVVAPPVLVFLQLPLLPRRQDALLLREALSPEPPAHALGGDVDRGELEHAVTQAAVPALVGPVEEEGEDAVAQEAVQARREDGVQGHHGRDEGVDAEEEAEHGRGDDAHEAEVGPLDERARVRRGSEGAEDGDARAQFGALVLRQGDQRLCCSLRVADQRQLREARLVQHARDEGREIEDAHVADVPRPHARVRVRQRRVLRVEAAAVVAQPDVVAGLAEEEGQAVVVVGAIRACALEEAGDQQDGIAAVARGERRRVFLVVENPRRRGRPSPRETGACTPWGCRHATG